MRADEVASQVAHLEVVCVGMTSVKCLQVANGRIQLAKRFTEMPMPQH